jgi:hypothetical protein
MERLDGELLCVAWKDNDRESVWRNCLESLDGEPGWRAGIESWDGELGWRKSSLTWDREHMWTIGIPKGLKIGLKHNKQMKNMIGIQLLYIFENRFIMETNLFCQLCNLTHTVEHSGRILACVDNYQIKKAQQRKPDIKKQWRFCRHDGD